ncbi:hypothetical protein PybrP1_011264 [[Pythium] brassicae (nom. inval.)]|nr:hypothetical protein PybrP1_011264 [[Pythium] brassicae (nom. inval.)]
MKGDDAIFESCLKKPLSDPTTDAQCRLVPDYGNAFALEFVLALRVYTAVWNAKVCFVLKPVPLEPIQIAEAVIRDLREELAQTRYLLNSTVDNMQHTKLLFLECDLSDSDGMTSRSSSSSSGGTSVLLWKRAWGLNDGGDGNYTEDSSGAIRIHCPGRHWINATLYHDERDAGAKHFALKQSSPGNSKRTAKEFPIECFGSCSTQPCPIIVTQDQEVTVVRTAKDVTPGEGSSLVVVPVLCTHAGRDASHRRSERQFVANAAAAASARPPPAKPVRRRSKTDPTVKPLHFWKPDEVAKLVAAWHYTIANPPAQARKTAGGFNARMYKRFLELSGGSSLRALSSMMGKKQLLSKSFQFIYDYNESRRAAAASRESAAAAATATDKKPARAAGRRGGAGDAAAAVAAAPAAASDDDEPPTTGTVNRWFGLSKAQRKAAGDRENLSEQRLFALLSLDRPTYDAMLAITKLSGKLSVRQPWTDDEMQLMFRAWRDAIARRGGKGARTKKFSVNTRMYQLMVALSKGAFKRTKQGVVLKKESMRLSHEFIARFNRERLAAWEQERAVCSSSTSTSSTAKAKLVTWFKLSPSEQERVVARRFNKSGFVYFTETQYREIDSLLKDTEQLHVEIGMRQGAMWTREEVALLVRAWGDVVDHSLERVQQMGAFGACVFERFVALAQGEFSRTERSTVLKLLALRNMHEFIRGYNRTAAAARETKRGWFAIARPERKRIHFEATKSDGAREHRSNTFTDLDRSLFDAIGKILATNRLVDGIPAELELKRRDEGDGDGGDRVQKNDKGLGNIVLDDDTSSSDGDDDTESDFEPFSSWGPSSAAVSKEPAELGVTASTADKADKLAAAAVRTNGDARSGSEMPTDRASDKSGDRAEVTSNSFLQTSVLQRSQQPPPPTASTSILDHRSIFGDDTPDDAGSSSSTSSDDDAIDFGSSSSDDDTLLRRPAAKDKPKPSARDTTSSSWSLHELADLAARVNDTGESSTADDGASRLDAEETPASASQQQPALRASKSPPKQRLSPEAAAIVQILHTQSEQLIGVMREIRDEMRRDREERVAYREEMQRDRERRKKKKDSDEDDEDDEDDDWGGKRGRSGSEERSPRKKKARRRLSVQREGFVVRL